MSSADILSASGRVSSASGALNDLDDPRQQLHRRSLYGSDTLKATAKLQILVAEDNDINVKICTKILQHVGGEQTGIDVVCNGRQVLCALERNPAYDLVLMDIHMPDMDGIEATKELLRRGVTCPIVALSADSTVQEECLTAGTCTCLYSLLSHAHSRIVTHICIVLLQVCAPSCASHSK